MDRPKIILNEIFAIDKDIILLSEKDNITDSTGIDIYLEEGVKVTVIAEEDAIADGVVIPRPDGYTGKRGKWFILLDHAFVPLQKYMQRLKSRDQ
jgi:hypothetical protein